jgi:hypothetical protein
MRCACSGSIRREPAPIALALAARSCQDAAELLRSLADAPESFMISNFEQVHNYYERLVSEEIVRRSPQYQDFTSDMLADVACVALNRLPARYVRHDVDLMFYLTEHERNAIDLSMAAAMDFAFNYVAQRAAKANA